MGAIQFFIGGCSGGMNPASVSIERSFAHPEVLKVSPFLRSEFGYHTTAFGVIAGDVGFFIDNGTGIQNVNQFFTGVKLSAVYGLQTHMHLDHRAGIQNNSALYKKGLVHKIFAPNLGGKSFQEFWAQDFAPENWPISPKTFGIDHTIETFECGDTLTVLDGVRTLRLNHPGGMRAGSSAGFRVQSHAGAVVIATDAELSNLEDREAYAPFVSGAELLYADVQYREREYLGVSGICNGPPLSRKGWGHSTPEMLFEALSLCREVPKRIVVGHHDTARSDEDLHRFELEMWNLFSPLGVNLRFARDGEHYTL